MQAYPLLARGPPLWGQDGGQGEERGRGPEGPLQVLK